MAFLIDPAMREIPTRFDPGAVIIGGWFSSKNDWLGLTDNRWMVFRKNTWMVLIRISN
jgi:hypothetical protein